MPTDVKLEVDSKACTQTLKGCHPGLCLGFLSSVPREGGPLPRIEGVSELFDGVVLSREAEDAFLIQALFPDVLGTLLDQDGHHVRPEALLVHDGV